MRSVCVNGVIMRFLEWFDNDCNETRLFIRLFIPSFHVGAGLSRR